MGAKELFLVFSLPFTENCTCACTHTHTVPLACTCACTHTHTVPFTENCTCAHTHTVPLACTLIEITLTEAMMDQCHTILRWDHKCDQPLHSLSSSQLLKCCWKTARVNDTAINKMQKWHKHRIRFLHITDNQQIPIKQDSHNHKSVYSYRIKKVMQRWPSNIFIPTEYMVPNVC